ncbi:MAG: hypothetical protein IJY60_06185 [Bacteroides sp.]|nr:hypothetical protein [Bacteroides sp.]
MFLLFRQSFVPVAGCSSKQADEWRKVFGQFTLQRRKKLTKTVYRLTFIHSKEAGYLCIRHKGIDD